MKKPFTLAITLLATSLSFAQAWTGVLKQKATPTSVKTTKVKTGTQKGGVGDKVSLNPQPLPPKTKNGSGLDSRASKVSLNPQPLPPKTKNGSGFDSRASKVSLNPQPLPPKTKNGSGLDSRASKVSLNPQPLPPKVAHGNSRSKIKTNVGKTAPAGAKNTATQR